MICLPCELQGKNLIRIEYNDSILSKIWNKRQTSIIVSESDTTLIFELSHEKTLVSQVVRMLL